MDILPSNYQTYENLPRAQQRVLLDSMTERMWDIEDLLEATRVGRALLMNIIQKDASHE